MAAKVKNKTTSRQSKDRVSSKNVDGDGPLADIIRVSQQLPVGVHMYWLEDDGSLIFVGANKAADQILGVRHHDILGKEIHEAFPALTGTEIPDKYREVCRTGEPWSTEHTEYRGEAIQGAFEVYAFQTTPSSMAALFLDVTRRKKDDTYKDGRLRLDEALVRASSALLVSDDLDATIEDALAEIAKSRNASRGYLTRLCNNDTVFCRTHEWCAPGVSSFIHDLQKVPAAHFPWLMQKLRANEAICIPDTRQIPPEGRAMQELLRAHNVKSLLILPLPVGDRLSGFVGFDDARKGAAWSDADLTMLRFCIGAIGAAIQRQQMQEKLRQNEQLYSNLFQQSKDAVIVANTEGRILDVNRTGLDMLGYRLPEIRKLHLTDLHPASELDRGRNGLQITLEKGAVDFETTLKRRDETTIPVNIAGSRVEVDGSTIIHGIIRDVSSRRQAEKEREQLELRLRQSQKMQAIGELAGGIAHDFNNLLTGIMGNAELITMMTDEDSEVAEMAHQIVSAASNAADLTRQLLAFSRQGRLQNIPVDLHKVIREVEQLIRRSSDPRIEIVLELNAANSHALGDPSWLKTSLLNLGLNGRDAMPDGGTLRFATRNIVPASKHREGNSNPAGLIEITVSDTGHGMDKETLDRIFEPFFTTKRHGHGTGLGLASSFGCIETHGGSMKVESELGKGSQFTVLLPACHADHEQSVSGTPTSIRRSVTEGHILVIDDEETIRNYAETALKHLGFTVSTARNGPEAIAFFEQSRAEVSLIILDMTMPKMSSTEVFKELHRISPDVTILLSSGYMIDQKARQLLSRGAAGFLNKPFLLDELAEKVYEQF